MLQRAIRSRGIKYLVHFTRLENLERILAEGLKSKDILDEENQTYLWNDELRLDGHTNAICCSISHPNYKMFYSLRREYPRTDWVVLAIRPSVLWEKEVAFCFTNAANSLITHLPFPNLQGLTAFNKLFEDVEGKPTRQELDLLDHHTTDPQAEILVFDTIEPDYILGVAFNDPRQRDRYKSIYPTKQIKYIPNFFSPRHDYKYWKNINGI